MSLCPWESGVGDGPNAERAEPADHTDRAEPVGVVRRVPQARNNLADAVPLPGGCAFESLESRALRAAGLLTRGETLTALAGSSRLRPGVAGLRRAEDGPRSGRSVVCRPPVAAATGDRSRSGHWLAGRPRFRRTSSSRYRGGTQPCASTASWKRPRTKAVPSSVWTSCRTRQRAMRPTK